MAGSSGRGRRGSGERRRGHRRKAGDTDLDLGSDKLYFKIGEVAEIVGVAPYVLRYWETEFRAIRPQKSRAQQRVYRRRDVETLLKIKHLLYDKKFTIAGARQQLHDEPETCEVAKPSGSYLAKQSLEYVRAQLDELASAILSEDLLDATSADPAAYVRAKGGARAFVQDDATAEPSLIAQGEHA